jgi:siroheme synthase (precorrin-2 oxidase/ferrochelatase)
MALFVMWVFDVASVLFVGGAKTADRRLALFAWKGESEFHSMQARLERVSAQESTYASLHVDGDENPSS